MFDVKKLAIVGSAVVFLSVLNGIGANAIPVAQEPATEAVIEVMVDGVEPFDSTTFDPGSGAEFGNDANDANGIVRNFDAVQYRVEVSLNDADDTNLHTTLTLSDNAYWSGVPLECKTAEDLFFGSPTSELLDLNADGLAETLVCNFGDHSEGTKLAIEPIAIAAGNNGETMTASITSTSDASVSDWNSDPVDTIITADFGIGISKAVAGLPRDQKVDYQDRYYAASVYGAEGRVVEWHISLNYNPGSEYVDDDGTGVQSFTLTDTWVGTHSNDPSVEGDNANGVYNDGIVLFGDIAGDPLESCALLTPVSGATVTCTQPGPGEPITIQIDDAPVNQATMATVRMQLWFPFSSIFVPNTLDRAETYDVNNTVELTGWGGAGTLVTSQTGSVDPGPEIASDDWLISASNSGGFLAYYKTFDNLGGFKTGQRAAGIGDEVETSLVLQDNSPRDLNIGICDTLDTTSLEFAGTDGPLQKDAVINGQSNNTTYSRTDRDVGWESLHNRFNPVLNARITGVTGNHYDATDVGVTVQFSDVDYAATGDDHWTATCEDDLTGDGNSDWVDDYNDLPGGESSVVRVRMLWDKQSSVLATLDNIYGTYQVFYSFNVRIKPTATVNSYIPNTASILTNSGVWFETIGGGPLYRDTETDPTNALYSFDAFNADRIWVLPASMTIDKTNEPLGAQGPYGAGDIATFRITPSISGSGPADQTVTIYDNLPNELAYVSDDCEAAASALGLTCTTTLLGDDATWTITGYTIGDPLPSIVLEAEVKAGTPAGAYTNGVFIETTWPDLADDSHCDTAVNSNGTVTTTSQRECRNAVVAGHVSRATILVPSEAGESVVKSDELVITEPNADWVTELTYTNLGGSDFGPGQLIDVVAFNGDGVVGSSTERFNQPTENPANANTETNTSDQDGRVDFVSVTPSAAGETFEYTTTDAALVDIRPCAPSNWPAGDSLGSGNALLDQICGLGLVDPATDIPTASQTGTGATDWTAAASADVTAIRASLPAFAAGEAERTIALTMNVAFAHEGDLLCNNFGLNSEIVTLDIISNDVCVEVVSGSIGDYVWADSNGDGVQDADESPISGVTLKLLDGAGNPILDEDGNPMTAVTDADGLYLFEELPSGDYTVMVDTATLPAGLTQSYDFDGAGDDMSVTSLVGPATDPTLVDVEDDLDQDFGYLAGSIGDYVWIDTNGDGVQDSDELPIEGVTVKLLDAAGGPVLDINGDPVTTVTDSAGLYLFDNVAFGTYTVMVDESTLPAGLSPTYDFDGGLDSMSVVTIDLTNPHDRDQDFGYLSGSIGDYVWFDADGDGVQDTDEDPIAGVTVKLLDGAGDPILDSSGNPVTAVTDSAGLYLFDDLPLGDYIVMIDETTLPLGVDQSYDFDGGLDNMSATTLSAAAPDDRDQDFGYVPPVYDVALLVDVAAGTGSELSVGDDVTFVIDVMNQGDLDVCNVGVIAYIPEGLILNDPAWELDADGNAVLVDPIDGIPAGMMVSVNIVFTIADGASGDLTLLSEITEFYGADCLEAVDIDSFADGELGDVVVDGVVDGTDGDEDDSDIAVITVVGTDAIAFTGASTSLLVGAGLLVLAAGLLLRRRLQLSH